jgi:predicted MFS family arabinose efflux permease
VAYLAELRRNWRALTAASIGLAAGTITNYINNLFTPKLIGQFGWPKAEVSLIGLSVLLGAVCLPIAGRLTDVIGVRRMALAGVISSPLLFVALSLMQGDFRIFFLLTCLQVVLVTCTVSITIYTRLISETFHSARGLALGIASCTPALVAALATPFLSAAIEAHGWRVGYRLVAAAVAAGGAAALLLIPREADRHRAPGAPKAAERNYGQILRNPAFGLIMAGMALTNLAITMQTTQLKVVLLDRGMSSAQGSLLVSVYASGVIIGRFLCGAALDRFPAPVVAALAMGLPSIGHAILGFGPPQDLLTGLAVLFLGLSIGGEGDVAAYLVMRHFQPQVYSTVLGLVCAAMSVAAAIGAVVMSYTVRATGGFTTFLAICAVCSFVGGAVFLLLGRTPRREPLEA